MSGFTESLESPIPRSKLASNATILSLNGLETEIRTLSLSSYRAHNAFFEYGIIQWIVMDGLLNTRNPAKSN